MSPLIPKYRIAGLTMLLFAATAHAQVNTAPAIALPPADGFEMTLQMKGTGMQAQQAVTFSKDGTPVAIATRPITSLQYTLQFQTPDQNVQNQVTATAKRLAATQGATVIVAGAAPVAATVVPNTGNVETASTTAGNAEAHITKWNDDGFEAVAPDGTKGSFHHAGKNISQWNIDLEGPGVLGQPAKTHIEFVENESKAAKAGHAVFVAINPHKKDTPISKANVNGVVRVSENGGRTQSSDSDSRLGGIKATTPAEVAAAQMMDAANAAHRDDVKFDVNVFRTLTLQAQPR